MKTALVTGATRGIGRATAQRLGDEGWWVLCTGRSEAEGAVLQRELQDRSGGRFASADLLRPESAGQLVDRAVHETGRLDLLVNNAGRHALSAIPDVPVSDYDELMSVNVRAAFLLSQAVIPAMRSQGGGVIVNVSSEAGISAIRGQAVYNMSKAALGMLTKSIVVDHTADGIRAVTVSPGTTRTPLVDEAIASTTDPDAHERMLAQSRPAGRLGRPEETAAVIAFAASDQAPYMTGCEIPVDGGKTAS